MGDDDSLYLVPADVIQSWRNKQTLDDIDRPLDRTVAQASEKVTRATDSSAPDIPYDANQKLLRAFGEFLQYKKLRENAVRPPPPAPVPLLPSQDAPLVDYTHDSVIERVPASYRHRAKKILEHWTSHEGGVTFDGSTGQISVNGSPLEGSNIVDLLRDAVSRRKARTTPLPGAETLMHYTRSHTTLPPTIFQNQRWKEGTTKTPYNATTSTLTEEDEERDYSDGSTVTFEHPFTPVRKSKTTPSKRSGGDEDPDLGIHHSPLQTLTSFLPNWRSFPSRGSSDQTN